MSEGGFSAARLERMRASLMRHVESGEVPGLVALVCRRGEVHVETLGSLAFDGRPVRRDSIFRIASLTKPITAAAAMILVEECRLRLDEPVEEWLPELANRQVLRRIDGPLDDSVPAARPITLRDLLTFRLGHGAVMVWPPQFPIQHAMLEAGISPSADLPGLPADELMRRYGSLPLLHQPGEKWLYSGGSDILGVLIARVSGQSLGSFLRERLFEPLGMKDTGFHVPEAKLDRLVTAYRGEPAGLAVFDEAGGGRFTRPPAFESGAGGLVSTADDYLAFCRMLLNQGRGPQRILSRRSVELMTTDHLTPEQLADRDARAILGDHRGWGFGLAVTLRRAELFETPGRFGWDGGYGTSAYTDPAEQMIGVLMTQRLMDSPQPPRVFLDFWNSAYQAIDD
ncbi:MAG TPA: serine hydrolase domain-containing protein [Paracoccaceae bacterium]|nr:serine hydrolase domain-containing protein [Paracoccaceae bacterium]